MTWFDPEFQPVIDEAKELVYKMFLCDLSANVFHCSLKEIKDTVIKEFIDKLRSPLEREVFFFELAFIEGRYFRDKNEIWLVEHRGNNLETLIHEYIHSIQKCNPHRENIVKYLTYKITRNIKTIENNLLKEWVEIEKIEGIKDIKKRLVTSGDCDDF